MAGPVSTSASWWKRALRTARRQPLGTIGLVLLVLLVLSAVLAPSIASYGPNEMLDAGNLESPSSEYLLGTDNLGRDTFSRVLHGGRVSLMVSIGAVALATVLGSVIGLVSGYFMGKTDIVLQRVMDAMMSIPTLILALVMSMSFGPTVRSLVLAIGFAFTPQVQRVVRSAVIAVRSAPFVEASRAGGARAIRTLALHVAPQVVAPTLVIATALLGQAIIIESAISFVGAGPPPTTPTWGGLLSAGSLFHPSRSFWLLFWPGVAISLTVFSFNMLGDAVRDVLDPRLNHD